MQRTIIRNYFSCSRFHQFRQYASPSIFNILRFSTMPFANLPIVEVHEGNFEDIVLHSHIPLILTTYSEKCPPCKTSLQMIMEEASKYDGHVKLLKVNIYKNPYIAEALGGTLAGRPSFKLTALPIAFGIYPLGKIHSVLIGQQSQIEVKEFVKRIATSPQMEI